MYGQELAEELGKMRGVVPNTGTIYPALSELEKRGLIDRKRRGRKNYYCLTDAGRRGSIEACRYFCTVYEDIFKEYGNIS